MFATVTTAQTLARQRAAELDRRNEVLRLRSERRATTGEPMPATRSRSGLATVLLAVLHAGRPVAAR